MKILNNPPIAVTAEMTITELRAIMKMIGDTSHASRKISFNLTEEESLAASDIFAAIYNLLQDNQ